MLLCLQAKALGKVLFEQVCRQLSLLEADYFGLEYQEVGSSIKVRSVTIFIYESIYNDKIQIFLTNFLFKLNFSIGSI